MAGGAIRKDDRRDVVREGRCGSRCANRHREESRRLPHDVTLRTDTPTAAAVPGSVRAAAGGAARERS